MKPSSDALKRGLAYLTITVTFVTALVAATTVKATISNSVAALGPELAKGVGMLGSFVVYLALLTLCALVVYPVLKTQTKTEENHEPKRKPVLSQQTPVPR